ncbi:hypothetical protein GCM10027514_29690 [Azotobacter armeniacus]
MPDATVFIFGADPSGAGFPVLSPGAREGLLLLDLKDFKALLDYLRDDPQRLGEDRALFTPPSAQALLRRLATLEQQSVEALFGEPALQLDDPLQPEAGGRGVVHLLDASRLVHESSKVYATFLLWLLAELFEQLPERGDAEWLLLGLFFDEAHLLFAAPKALQERLEQVVRLIRSKGVGVYFVTQLPGDLPDGILAARPACLHCARAEGPACGRRGVSLQPGLRNPGGAGRPGHR